MAFEMNSADGYDGLAVADAAPMDRAAFLNKVYLTMSAGIAGAMGVGFYVSNDFLASGGLTGNHWLLTLVQMPLLLAVVFLVSSFAVQLVARVKGINIAAFIAFVAMTGALVLAPGFAAAALKTGSYDIVWNAFGITTLVFGGLTAFVLFTGKDFSFLGGFLTVATLIAIGFAVATLYIGAPAFQMAVVCGILALYLIWVLYDTSVIMKTMSPDMWMAGALALFIDFVMILIRVLWLLMHSAND